MFATITVTVAARSSPPPSVTLAVIVCVLFVRRPVTVPPVPSDPSMFDSHAMDDVRSPLSRSEAAAVNEMRSLVRTCSPSAGLEMAMVGALSPG